MKTKEKILKAVKEKQYLTYKCVQNKQKKNVTRFQIKNHGDQRKWQNNFQGLKEKDRQPRIRRTVETLFRNEGRSRHSQMKQN